MQYKDVVDSAHPRSETSLCLNKYEIIFYSIRLFYYLSVLKKKAYLKHLLSVIPRIIFDIIDASFFYAVE